MALTLQHRAPERVALEGDEFKDPMAGAFRVEGFDDRVATGVPVSISLVLIGQS